MPKIVDHAAERKTIAQAAIGVISASGLEAARLRDVAAAAEVTTGAVTHYFESKDALLEATLTELADRLCERLAEAPKGRVAPDDLVEFCLSILPVDEENRQGWRSWLSFWGRAIVNPRLRRLHQRAYARFTANLAPVSGANAARARDLADAIIAVVDGIGIRATLEPREWPPERQRRALRTLLLPLLKH